MDKISEELNKPIVYTADQLSAWAKQAIENPILGKAFEDLKQIALNKFEISQARDAEGREGAYWFLKALNEFRGQLRCYLIEEKKENPLDKFNFA